MFQWRAYRLELRATTSKWWAIIQTHECESMSHGECALLSATLESAAGWAVLQTALSESLCVKLSRHGKSPGREKSWVTLERGDPIRTKVDPILNHRVRRSWCGICLSYILDKEETECYCSPTLFYYFIWPKAPRKHKGWVVSLSYVPFKWQGIKCQWLNLFSTVELVACQLSSGFLFFFFGSADSSCWPGVLIKSRKDPKPQAGLKGWSNP